MDSKGARELFDGQAHLYNLTFNYVNSMALKCAMELGIADIIHNHKRPITLPELASALEINPSKTKGLHRLMRLLVHSHLFSATQVDDAGQQEEAYALTPSSILLVNDHPNSLAPYVLLSLLSITSFNSLSKWFKGNELTACETTYGVSLWEHMEKQNPEFGTIFDQAMASDSQMANLVIKECKPIFEGIGMLVDVGGGTGTFCKVISESFPGIKCTVFDLPRVVADCPDTENLKFIGGDMFNQPIPRGDAILLKLLFHGYGDEDSLKVLKGCREVITSKGKKGGKLIIIDIVINEKRDEHELTETKLFYDLLMMVHVTGKERTEKDWERIFLEAGYSHYKITPIFGLRSLIEVYP